MKVALIVGVILSSPIWLYQIWAFVAPGLHAREKRWSYIFLGAAIPLFGIGDPRVLSTSQQDDIIIACAGKECWDGERR